MAEIQYILRFLRNLHLFEKFFILTISVSYHPYRQ